MSTRTLRHRPSEYLVTLIEAIIIVTSLAYVVTGNLATLIVWETIATLYLLVGFVVTRRRSLAGARDSGRSGVLDTLSWVLPLAASLVGISAAIHVLVVRAMSEAEQSQSAVPAVAASVAIILSWHLLHTGFAQIYETSLAKYPDNAA